MEKWVCAREARGPDLSLASRDRKRRRKYRVGLEWGDEGQKGNGVTKGKKITNKVVRD